MDTAQKQLPENIARALYNDKARLHFARQLLLWEVYFSHHIMRYLSVISYCSNVEYLLLC